MRAMLCLQTQGYGEIEKRCDIWLVDKGTENRIKEWILEPIKYGLDGLSV